MTHLFGRISVASYARSSTMRGLASVMDLTGNTVRQHRYYATPAEADAAAIRDDWEQVGGSIHAAAETYRHGR